MWDHAVLNGTIVTDREIYPGNIYIKGGKIARSTTQLLPEDAAETTDASGKLVFPGFIETHAHSRDGRQGTGKKEDFSTSSAAAAATGITTMFEMPNCFPPLSSAAAVEDLVKVITPKAHVDFAVWGLALGDANLTQIPEIAAAGVIAFKFFWGYAIDKKTHQLIYNYSPEMKDALPPPDEGEIYRLFEKIRSTGLRVGVHAENFNIIKARTEREKLLGNRDYEALLRMHPVSCETSVIDTAIDMAQEIGVPLHILHVGVGEGVEHIRQAKKHGADVTAETCSHYLALTNQDYARCGSLLKTYPLIRTERDRELVWQGVQDGTIDWVCSDHAPHTLAEKQQDLLTAPAGISGIEALTPVILNAVNEGKINLYQAAAIGSANAARTFGLYPRKGTIAVGADGDLAIVDMSREYVFDQTKMYSKAKWTPYDGMRIQGKVVKTILRGRTVMEDGVVSEGCCGAFVRPGQQTE